MKHFLPLLAGASLCIAIASCGHKATETDDNGRVVVAYVTSWSDVIPDPSYMTHINYSFGHVDSTFDGMHIDNPDRLDTIVALKAQNPDLKVLVSVGGWASGNFSEMAADSALRQAFALSCLDAVRKHNLDGIDIDWEYPTNSESGISSSPDDTQNFTALIHDLREVLGDDLLLTFATPAVTKYVDFPAILPYVDFVNIMAYDMANPPYHHSGLYPSEHTGWCTSSGAVERHREVGVPDDKLVLGMPLYGRGHREVLNDSNVVIKWDEVALVPYAVMCDTLALGFENVESITHKCQYILDQNLRGAMYWEYNSEKGADHPMARTIRDMIILGE